MGFDTDSSKYDPTICDHLTGEKEKMNIDNNHYSNLQNDLYDKVASCIDTNAMTLTIATKSAMQIVRWTSRLFQLLEKLPIIREDISVVICNIYDLYYLTVFRLCMGNKSRERIVLGLEQRSSVSDFPMASLPLQQQQLSSQRLVSATLPRNTPFSRRQRNTSHESLSSSTHSGRKRYTLSDTLPPHASIIHNGTFATDNHNNLQHIEADIYAPLRSEKDLVKGVTLFLQRGKISLSDIVDLDKIEGWSSNTAPLPCVNSAGAGPSAASNQTNPASFEKGTMHEVLVMQKRIIASFSCLFVSCVFDTAMHRLKLRQDRPTFRYLFTGVTDQCYQQEISCGLSPSSATATVTGSEAVCTDLNSNLVRYWMQMQDASTHMHLLCMRMSTIRAIKGENVVRRIISIGSGWTAEILNESCNDYVDALSKRCTLLWGHMSLHSTFLTQESMLLQAWDHIIESGFVSILEGFSRVCCSTEGRASMSIDLATFCASVNGQVIESRLESYFDCVGRLPPSSAPQRGMQYVDLYVKVFYFPEDDVMKWIIENRHLYHLSHVLALVSYGMINPLSQALLQEQVKLL